MLRVQYFVCALLLASACLCQTDSGQVCDRALIQPVTQITSRTKFKGTLLRHSMNSWPSMTRPMRARSNKNRNARSTTRMLRLWPRKPSRQLGLSPLMSSST